MMLLSDVLTPWCDSSSTAARQTEGLQLLAVKGPGDSLGVPLLPPRSQRNSSGGSGSGSGCERRWKVCVVARGRTTVFTARLEELGRLVEAHPEMEGAVQQIVHQQETDMMVAEAMRMLRLRFNTNSGASTVHTDCHRSLGPSGMDVDWQPQPQEPLA